MKFVKTMTFEQHFEKHLKFDIVHNMLGYII